MLTDGQITLAHIISRPTATPPTAPSPVNRRTDYTCSYYATPTAAPPPVNGRTDDTCSYSATPTAAPLPVNGRTNYTCSYSATPTAASPPVNGWKNYTCSYSATPSVVPSHGGGPYDFSVSPSPLGFRSGLDWVGAGLEGTGLDNFPFPSGILSPFLSWFLFKLRKEEVASY